MEKGTKIKIVLFGSIGIVLLSGIALYAKYKSNQNAINNGGNSYGDASNVIPEHPILTDSLALQQTRTVNQPMAMHNGGMATAI